VLTVDVIENNLSPVIVEEPHWHTEK
jgi:hypothetical protein